MNTHFHYFMIIQKWTLNYFAILNKFLLRSMSSVRVIVPNINNKTIIQLQTQVLYDKQQTFQTDNKMEAIYWGELAITITLSAILIFYYADRKAAVYAQLLVFISILCSLICYAILPIDIYQSSQENSTHLAEVEKSWLVIYYINFFMCWFILPFAQEYEDSGEFTFSKKIKESLVMNGILIGMLCVGAILIVIYIIVAASFTISQLPSVFATLVNIVGLTLVSILLGYGLISFPKECFLRKDYKKLVNYCHRQAEAIKSEQHAILQEVSSIQKVLGFHGRRDASEIRIILTLIQQSFKFQNIILDDQQTQSLAKKSTADLHKIIKKRILQKLALESQLDELVDDLKGTTESYLKNNYSLKKFYYSFLFILTTVLSILIFFAELATFAQFLAPANVLALVSYGGTTGWVINTLLTAYVAYIVTHTIFRVKVYKVFSLHRGHSSASSLLFTAINLSRVCYPLCYNYLQITGLPESSFLQFFGEVTIRAEIMIIFPILMLTFAVFNIFNLYDKIMGYLGFGSYAFDDEQAQQKKEEGRNILIERFKSRNLENKNLQMIQLL